GGRPQPPPRPPAWQHTAARAVAIGRAGSAPTASRARGTTVQPRPSQLFGCPACGAELGPHRLTLVAPRPARWLFSRRSGFVRRHALGGGAGPRRDGGFVAASFSKVSVSARLHA